MNGDKRQPSLMNIEKPIFKNERDLRSMFGGVRKPSPSGEFYGVGVSVGV
jgi:hypothetical protein